MSVPGPFRTSKHATARSALPPSTDIVSSTLHVQKSHKPTSRLSVRMRLGRSHNSVRSPWVSTFEKAGTPSRSAKVIGTVWAWRALVCMAEVSDLPNAVASCRGLPGMRMLRRNAFGMGLPEKPQRSGPENVTLRTRLKRPKCQNEKKNERLRPCMI